MDYGASTAWPPLHPPLLTRLPRPPVHPNPSSLPPSQRFRSTQFPTLQDEADQLDWDEDQWVNSMHDTRGFGFSWLVPLGRQNTQEEDAESAFSSPRATSAEPLPDEALPNGDVSMEGEAAPDLDAEIEDADVTRSDTESVTDEGVSGVQQEGSAEEVGMRSLEELTDSGTEEEG